MGNATAYTVQPYRYAFNEAGFAYARVRHDPDGAPNLIECSVDHRDGRKHWRRMWRKGQSKPMSTYCKQVLNDARCHRCA